MTSRGRMIRLSAMELPTLPDTAGAPSLGGGAPLAAYVDLPRGEEPLTIVPWVRPSWCLQASTPRARRAGVVRPVGDGRGSRGVGP